MLNNYFDKAVMLSVDKRRNKWASPDIGMPIDRFVVGWGEHADLTYGHIDYGHRPDWSFTKAEDEYLRYEKHCNIYDSHFKMIRSILQTNAQHILLLEDDIVLLPSAYKNIDKAMGELDYTDWDLLYFCGWVPTEDIGGITHFKNYWIKAPSILELAFVGVKRYVLEYIYSLYHKKYIIVDEMFRRYAQKTFKTLRANPQIAVQKGNTANNTFRGILQRRNDKDEVIYG